MLANEEDREDPDKNVRFANDEVVGDSDNGEEDNLVDYDEESIDEDEEKPRNPFKAPKQHKEYVPKAKGNQKKADPKKQTTYFGQGKSRAEII